ncbi:MAG: ADP-ribosylglycohydrolase family protein [Candidatus Marinimicrobia bacterium]|nr:ADP-ribosylglycohydrolase family protein [Candidatus Neomarinimicrobiota bacterium]
MSGQIKARAVSTLYGLAVGEALSWSSMFSRAQELPKWLERIRHTIETEMGEYNSTSLPKPFSLNQAPDKLIPGPGDLAEWAAWTTMILLENRGNLDHAILHKAWQELASSTNPIRGRISVQTTLRNFRNDLTAPQSGRFNPHYFDDAALPRAVMIGVAHTGNPAAAKALAELDASFTQFEDGIWSATAVATLFSQACNGASVSDIIQGVIKGLPADSLTKTTVMHALNGIDPAKSSIVDTAFFLNTEICNQIYSYGNIAHEILASLLSILKTTGGNHDLMMGCAALVPSGGGTLLALSSALGAVIEGKTLVENPQDHLLKGVSLPALKGVDINDIANQFGELVIAKINSEAKGK